MNSNAYHIFAVVEVNSGSVLFASQIYSCVKKFYDGFILSVFPELPRIKHPFRLVKYDLNPRYKEDFQPSFASCLGDAIKGEVDKVFN